LSVGSGSPPQQMQADFSTSILLFRFFHFRRSAISLQKKARQTSAGGRIMIFENQTVLVSGCGIGKEIALSFAREGANIGFADVNEETAQATASEIRKLGLLPSS
jgi:2-polyprenyl-3-methyl-5-hydroxy-6-metoxy-1,4-benzoquinol methylase